MLITRYPHLQFNPLTASEMELIFDICSKPTDKTEDVKRFVDLSDFTGKYTQDVINSHRVGGHTH
ncbi:Putative uncharacterized protein [Moritella viscosa]|uniref:Uncharacterized protein n=2 Tax=Moritella viscosa TaxID=80854 RepID=A0A1L0AJL7_9GAMM|nr:Putative uncharacterized protein [Moritella viscosa]